MEQAIEDRIDGGRRGDDVRRYWDLGTTILQLQSPGSDEERLEAMKGDVSDGERCTVLTGTTTTKGIDVDDVERCGTM